MGNTNTATPFALELARRIKRYITAARKDGTTAMGIDNLAMVVRMGPDTYNLEGAPNGTNAPYFFKVLFREVLKTLPTGFKSFILPDAPRPIVWTPVTALRRP